MRQLADRYKKALKLKNRRLAGANEMGVFKKWAVRLLCIAICRWFNGVFLLSLDSVMADWVCCWIGGTLCFDFCVCYGM
ncbi:MAG: hypothetical protein LBQ98_00475 [Nitrososphaerota archaeon]|jgi:hypothetical protein|nr:hypothetical protein [Nitrososphaerota archaeon]